MDINLLIFLFFMRVSGENIALGKSTWQSSFVENKDWGPENAVNGDTMEWFVNGTYSQFLCTHTHADSQPWWVVDLGDTYNITNVVVYNRQTDQSVMVNDYDIDVFGKPTCFSDKWATFFMGRQSRCYYQAPSVAYLNASCNVESIGRFVRIQLRNSGHLWLCEVEVYGNLITSLTVESSPKEACGFFYKEYSGISLATLSTRSNIECVIRCYNTDSCCAGVYEKSTKECVLKRKLNTDENTSHHFIENEKKETWVL